MAFNKAKATEDLPTILTVVEDSRYVEAVGECAESSQVLAKGGPC